MKVVFHCLDHLDSLGVRHVTDWWAGLGLGYYPQKIIPYDMIERMYEKYNILKAFLDNIALTTLIA